MTLSILLTLFLLTPQIQLPKNDPNGLWEADSGSKFEFRLTGSDLKVQLVEGSNPNFLKYELSLKNAEEANTYKGNGYFIAKLQNGKECRFDTEWEIVVVSPERILGATSAIIPDPETCQVQERTKVQLDLKKKK